MEKSLEYATFIGIGINEFWDITPAELIIAVESFNKGKELEAKEFAYKFEAQQKAMIYQAYLTSRWVWQKKININKFLNIEKKHEQMTDEQMLNQVKLLNNLFGGVVVEHVKER